MAPSLAPAAAPTAAGGVGAPTGAAVCPGDHAAVGGYFYFPEEDAMVSRTCPEALLPCVVFDVDGEVYFKVGEGMDPAAQACEA